MQLNELKAKIKESSSTAVEYGSRSVISYSQLYKYSTCPKSWELAYVRKLRKSSPSIHTVFGTSLHETLQHYLTLLFEKSVKEADELDLGMYLQSRMVENYKAEYERAGEHFTDASQLGEFCNDGVQILKWIKNRRRAYFGPKGYELLGIELPLYLPANTTLNPNVYFLAYIDLILYDKTFNRVKIIDIKTSTRGWSESDKKDTVKKSQVMLYKHFFNEQFNVPLENIEVEYFIVRRKLYEESEFPQKRVQIFTPPQGRPTINKSTALLESFVKSSFKVDGSYNTDREYPAIAGPNGKNCKFCEFKDDPSLCPANKRLETLPD